MPLTVKHEIFRLEISMCDSIRVQIFQKIDNFCNIKPFPLLRQFCNIQFDELNEFPAFTVLQNEIKDSFVLKSVF